MNDEQTICAISTPSGNGAIAIVRVSGKEAILACENIFRPTTSGKKLSEQKAYSLHHGWIVDNERFIDEVVIGIFRNPNSYSGEDLIEISCHGSVFIQKEIVELLLRQGVRYAKPGEFTLRAFLNGKMDLSQAEAVADLIASDSAASHKIAIKQMKGGFSDEIKILRNELIKFSALLELELDFSEEDVEFADRNELKKLILQIKSYIYQLINSFKLGNVLKNGVPVAIIGEPNVGKSTLLNVLLNEERAIVSEIPGTTRDYIEDTINIDGILFRIIDTAGLRHSDNLIENLGIEKTFNIIKQAEIVLLVLDANNDYRILKEKVEEFKIHTNDKKLIVVINKIDLQQDMTELIFEVPSISISAKKKISIESLKNKLLEAIKINSVSENDIIVSNIRHYEALVNAGKSIERVIEAFESNVSSDLIALDIKQAAHFLGEILGLISNEDVLEFIFKNFCIGK